MVKSFGFCPKAIPKKKKSPKNAAMGFTANSQSIYLNLFKRTVKGITATRD